MPSWKGWCRRPGHSLRQGDLRRVLITPRPRYRAGGSPGGPIRLVGHGPALPQAQVLPACPSIAGAPNTRRNNRQVILNMLLGFLFRRQPQHALILLA